MIPINLKLSNFTSYGESPPELNFTKFKLAAISGPNGAGKSSLLDAITWCLWGQSRAGDSSDDLVHLGASEMFVEFAFELDSHLFTVIRQRVKKSGGTTSLELWSTNQDLSKKHNLTEGTIKATQEKIVNLIHLNFETFTNSAFLRQDHADEFTLMGPTDRKRILADILGLSHYDKLEEKAKDKVRYLESKLKLLEYQLLEIEAEFSQKESHERELILAKQKVGETEKNIKILEEELKTLNKEREKINLIFEQRKKLEQNFEEQKGELAEILNQGKQRAERIKNLELRIKNLTHLEEVIYQLKKDQKELDQLKKLQQKNLELQKQISDLKGGLNLKNQQREILENEIKDIEGQIKNLSFVGAKCPTCGQEIGKDEKHNVKEQLENKLKITKEACNQISIREEKEQLEKLIQTLQTVSFDEKRIKEFELKLSQLDSLQKQKEETLQKKAALNTEQMTLLELRTLYKNKNDQVNKLEKELSKLSLPIVDLSSIDIKITQKENELGNIRNEEKQAQGLLGRATELISRAQQLEKLIKQKQLEKQNLEKEKEIFNELTLAFGKKGIQAMIIEASIPEIEEEANKFLDRLTDGRMKIALVTQKETKTKLADGEKGIVETLDIIISDEMGERSYEMYSGGEAFRVNLSIRLAISKLLTHRAGAKLQFLVIDEGFGSQDTQGRARLVEVIESIKNDFEKILIITHIEELKEEFPVRIEVSKDSRGSTFEVIGV